MRAINLGHILIAVGMAGLGVLSLATGDFAFVWQPVPNWMVWREALARISGAFLVICGLGMLTRRTATGSILLMTAYLLTWVLLQEFPNVVHAPANVGVLLGAGESVMLLCGCCLILGSHFEREPAKATGTSAIRLLAERGRPIAIRLIGISCLILGISHFVYTGITADMVPGWLPNHVFIARLTGVAHFAAGLGMLFMITPRLAATLEAAMISSFALLIQMPGVFSDPSASSQWMKLFAATAIAGSVWTVAHSLRGTQWGLARHRQGENAA
jgi:uncharacterized membrane protein